MRHKRERIRVRGRTQPQTRGDMLQNPIYIIHFFNLISRKKVSRRDAKSAPRFCGVWAVIDVEGAFCAGAQNKVSCGCVACTAEVGVSRARMDAVYLARKPRRRKARRGSVRVSNGRGRNALHWSGAQSTGFLCLFRLCGESWTFQGRVRIQRCLARLLRRKKTRRGFYPGAR